MRRFTLHLTASTSTISSDLLQATKTDEPVIDGWAQVGEQETSPGLGGSMPWPPMSIGFAPGEVNRVCGLFISAIAGRPVFGAAGEPFMPISRPFVSRKFRETFKVAVSISTSKSSIMQAE